MNENTILDAGAVAELLRCTREQAEDLMRRDELPATKIGRGWITTYSELLGFVARRIRTERKREAINATVGEPVKSKRRQLAQLPAATR
jgi:hypothetical protein